MLQAPKIYSHRFIPACAGNTTCMSIKRSWFTVHPRVCGEHTTEFWKTTINTGSSPRVRGTQCSMIRATLYHRFIPACAGNTFSERKAISRFTVHPRVCGEHMGIGVLASKVDGSSPRVRGTLHPAIACSHQIRFIPACAGNTFESS